MKTRYSRQVRGATIIEALVACAISSLLILTMLSVASTVARSNDRQLVSIPLAASGRTAMDEMLFQLRAAKNILPSQTMNGTKITSSDKSIVFSAPAYKDSAAENSDVTLGDGSTDTIAFTFDAASKKLYETIVPQSGSARKARSRFLLADKVVDVTYTYHAHEHFHYSSPSILNQIVSLKGSWSASSPPTVKVLVNSQAALSYLANPNQTLQTIALLNIPQGNADVDIFYIVKGGSGGTIPFDVVTKVDATVVIQDIDGRRIPRTFTIAGSANLRNERTTSDES